MYLFSLPVGVQGGSKETVYQTSRTTDRVTSQDTSVETFINTGQITSGTTSYNSAFGTSHSTSWLSSWATSFATGRSTNKTTSHTTSATVRNTSHSTDTSWTTMGITSQPTMQPRAYYYDGKGADYYLKDKHQVKVWAASDYFAASVTHQEASGKDENGIYGSLSSTGYSLSQSTNNFYVSSNITSLAINGFTSGGDPNVNIGKSVGGYIIGAYQGDWFGKAWLYSLNVPTSNPKNIINPSYATYTVTVQGNTSWQTALANTSTATLTTYPVIQNWTTSYTTTKQTFYLTSKSTSVTTSGITNYNTTQPTSHTTTYTSTWDSKWQTSWTSNWTTTYNSVYNTSHITYG